MDVAQYGMEVTHPVAIARMELQGAVLLLFQFVVPHIVVKQEVYVVMEIAVLVKPIQMALPSLTLCYFPSYPNNLSSELVP